MWGCFYTNNISIAATVKPLCFTTSSYTSDLHIYASTALSFGVIAFSSTDKKLVSVQKSLALEIKHCETLCFVTWLKCIMHVGLYIGNIVKTDTRWEGERKSRRAVK